MESQKARGDVAVPAGRFDGPKAPLHQSSCTDCAQSIPGARRDGGTPGGCTISSAVQGSLGLGGGRGGTRRAEPPSDRREAETFDRTSGMSWKSALESSVPMDSAMKKVRMRLKNAFRVHGTMRRPSSEATFIIDTLRKPKPHTAEREEMRGRHYQGRAGEG